VRRVEMHTSCRPGRLGLPAKALPAAHREPSRDQPMSAFDPLRTFKLHEMLWGMSRGRLELIRWVSAAVAAAIFPVPIILGWRPEGGWGVLAFFGFILFGAPVAMLTLHLHPPKWLGDWERPKP